jgi:hypothetical protein
MKDCLMIWNRGLLASALLAVAPLWGQPASSPAGSPYAAVSAQAAQTKKDYAIFFEGPEWLPESAQVRKLWDASLFAAKSLTFAGCAIFSIAEQVNHHKMPAKERPAVLPYNLPAVVLFDASGQAYAASEGLTQVNAKQVFAALAGEAARRVKRDEWIDKARAAKGVEKAKLLGKALDQVVFEFARQHRALIAEIKAADPEDVSGYTFKYTFSAGGFHEKSAHPLIREKKYSELFALVDKHLLNPVLLPEQRQALLSAKMQGYRASEDIPKAVETLRAIQALAPSSELGRGAPEYIRLLTEPVRLSALRWETTDNRPVWLPMVVNADPAVTGPGRYKVEFRHKQGHTRFRQVSLKAGTRTLVAVPNEKQATTVELDVPHGVPMRGLELWAESMGTGWFDGRGEIIVTKQ